jgi:hypothetical protein
MRRRMVAVCLLWMGCLAGCAIAPSPAPTGDPPPVGSGGSGAPVKSIPPLAAILDSVYLPLERGVSPPAGYGLYTVVLARRSDAATQRVLAELLTRTYSATDAALEPVNLNLITFPVRDARAARAALTHARAQPAKAASELLGRSYDFGQAARLLAGLCRAEQPASVRRACGPAAQNGPWLLSTVRPVTDGVSTGQRLLLVNLGSAPPEALREVFAAYSRQIARQDFADRAELDGWRLWALNHILEASKLLPPVSKAYAGGS